MTKLFLAPFLFVSTLSQASHFINCDVEAKVESVSNVQRLNDSVVFSRQQSLVPSDHEQMITLEIVSVKNTDGSSRCFFSPQERVTLMVKAKEINKYPEGETLKIQYQNVGDAAASRISWYVVE